MKKVCITLAVAAFATAGFAQTTAFDGITGNSGIYGISFGTSIYENMYGEDITTTTGPITLNSLNVDLVSESATAYTDVQCLVSVYSTYTGLLSGSSSEFSGLLSTTTLDFGAQTLAANSYYAITGLALNNANVTGNSFGITITWLANTGAGLTGAANLETGTTITVPTIGANFTPANMFGAVGATGSTNLTGGSSWTLGSNYPNIDMAIQVAGTPAPEPVSMAFLGLGVVGLIARRRRRS